MTHLVYRSECSVRELNTFVDSLGTGLRPPNCLLDSDDSLNTNPLRFTSQSILPGQQYPIDVQCSIFHGDCWRHELRDTQTLQVCCPSVWEASTIESSRSSSRHLCYVECMRDGLVRIG